MKRKDRNRKFLFDLNHPADFHFFKNLFSYMRGKGYSYRIIARDKECLHALLHAEGISFISRGAGSHFLSGKYLYALYNLLLSFVHLVIFRPELTLSLSSPYLITISKLLHIPTMTYDDTDINPRLHPLIRRADYIFSPANYPHTFHKNHFHISTYKELAYLDPVDSMGNDDKHAIFFRMTRTDSVHHTSETFLNRNWIIQEINRISLNYTTFLSSETGALNDLSEKVLFPDVVDVHDVLKKCLVFWGNSATMATEAVILGIPAIFVGAERFAYINELEDHGLLYCFSPDEIEQSFSKLDDLISGSPSIESFMRSRDEMLNEKISITELLIWFIENLPDSVKILRNDSKFQFRFKK